MQMSLRSSLVHGRKESPEEKRVLSIADLQNGMRVSGYVINSGPKGILVALSRTLNARIKLSMISDEIIEKDAVSQLYPIGKLIRDATVVEIRPDEEQVEISLRKVSLTLEHLSVGDVVSARVRRVTDFGIFAQLDNSLLTGLIHKSEVSDTASASLDSYKQGDRLSSAKVIRLDHGKVALSIKASAFAEGELDNEVEDDEDEDELPDRPPQQVGDVASVEINDNLEKVKDKTDSNINTPESTAKRKTQDPDVEAAPWEQAMLAPLTGLDDGHFQFAEFQLPAQSDAEVDEEDKHNDGSADDDKRPTKRQKKAAKLAKQRELQQQEQDMAEAHWATDPRSVEDFERLLLSKGDTSIVWIRYMAFHLKLGELEQARQVSERAVKHVGFSDVRERFNTWVAFMNLECTFGTDETADSVFRRAVSHNIAKHVYLQYARIHERNKKTQKATGVYETCCTKFPQSKKVWLSFLTFMYQQGDLEGGRKTLPKCLAALPRRKHPVVVSKAALLEYRLGAAERGRSIFEGLLDSYPKRTDLWSVYIDAHIKAHTPPSVASADLATVRSLLERCCSQKLKAVKMRFFFKRWLDFEKRWGDVESQETVRAKAREFVSEQAA